MNPGCDGKSGEELQFEGVDHVMDILS